MQIDQSINEFFTPLANALHDIIFYEYSITENIDIPLIVVWMACISIFTTFYFKFVNIRYMKRGLGLALGRYKHADDDKAEGQITPFQALTTTLSATVGLGNIAGVAIAISIGGPGAIVWMILMGVLGMSTKFLEASLGVLYRTKTKTGIFSGGPMYYLRQGFAEMDMPNLGVFLAAFFAICCIAGALGAGNMFQVNQVFQQLVHVTGGEGASFWDSKGWIFGLMMATAVGVVIIGGIQSIAAVASKIVPIMGITYLLAGLVVIFADVSAIPDAVQTIITSAFSTEAGIGGLIGGIIQGVRRAVFSNEAGIGSAAITHAVAKTNYPVAQGMVAMLGAFFDTVVICTITALVIVVSGVYQMGGDEVQGIALTSQGFESVMPWFPYALTFIVFMFAYSTMISWFYYGLKAVTFLLGQNDVVEWGYKIIFCLFIAIGASSSLDIIIKLSDSMYFAMAIPNIIALYVFAPRIKGMLNKYTQSIEVKRK